MHISVRKKVSYVVRSNLSTQPPASRQLEALVSSHRVSEQYNGLVETMTGESMNSPWRMSYTFLIHLSTSSLLQLLLVASATIRELLSRQSRRHHFFNGKKKHVHIFLVIPPHVSLVWNLRAVLRTLKTSFLSTLTGFNPTIKCIATDWPWSTFQIYHWSQ